MKEGNYSAVPPEMSLRGACFPLHRPQGQVCDVAVSHTGLEIAHLHCNTCPAKRSGAGSTQRGASVAEKTGSQ